MTDDLSPKLQVYSGPAITDPVDRSDSDLTATLRVITSYRIQTDQMVMRLDVLINNQPVGAGLRIGGGGDQHSTCMIVANGDLLIPKNGIDKAISIKAHPEDLIRALRGLADKLEEKWKR